jgi:XTP/dITP diphosphohydrolase
MLYCFYAKIGSETDDFDIADVCNEIWEVNPPHIYGDTVVKDEEEVGIGKTKTGSRCCVPKSLPVVKLAGYKIK